MCVCAYFRGVYQSPGISCWQSDRQKTSLKQDDTVMDGFLKGPSGFRDPGGFTCKLSLKETQSKQKIDTKCPQRDAT